MNSEKIFSQPIATLTFQHVDNSIETPVYIDLDCLTSVADSSLVLQQVTGNRQTSVPFQIEHGYRRFLWWSVKKEGLQKSKSRYLNYRGRTGPILHHAERWPYQSNMKYDLKTTT